MYLQRNHPKLKEKCRSTFFGVKKTTLSLEGVALNTPWIRQCKQLNSDFTFNFIFYVGIRYIGKYRIRHCTHFRIINLFVYAAVNRAFVR